jgi:hypothetical protein
MTDDIENNGMDFNSTQSNPEEKAKHGCHHGKPVPSDLAPVINIPKPKIQ